MYAHPYKYIQETKLVYLKIDKIIIGVVDGHSTYIIERKMSSLWPRSRALKPGLIRFFFHPEQCFPLTESSRIPPNHPNSSRTIPSERGLCVVDP